MGQTVKLLGDTFSDQLSWPETGTNDGTEETPKEENSETIRGSGGRVVSSWGVPW